MTKKYLPTIFYEEQKFLGKVLFPLGNSSDTFKLVKPQLFNKLENLDKTLIRKEYKLWIYQNYLIPSIDERSDMRMVQSVESVWTVLKSHSIRDWLVGYLPWEQQKIFELSKSSAFHPLLHVHQEPLAVLSSYYIFINRKTADWDTDTPANRSSFWTRPEQFCILWEFKKKMYANY